MKRLQQIRTWLRAPFEKRRLDAEMEEEMRLHIELRTEEYIESGMRPEQARYAALRQFGWIDSIKETCREERGWLWIEQLIQDLRFGIRMLLKTPGFTAVAIISLAIGIGLNTAVFSIINTIFYQSIRGVPQPNRVLVFNDNTSSFDGYEHLREYASDVAAITASRGTDAMLSIGKIQVRSRVGLVASNYFTVLGVRPALGRLLSASEGTIHSSGEPEVVLNYAFWKIHLGSDPSVIGSAIRINDVSATIVGVADPAFHGAGPEGPPLWLPLGVAPRLKTSKPETGTERLALLGRLRPGVTLPQAQAAIDVVVERSRAIFGENVRFRLSAGREDWRGEASAEKRAEMILVTTVPLIIAGGLLWIACSNVGNLLLARAVHRQKEIAIRVASGASRGRIIRMMMTESLLLAFCGGVTGLWVSRSTLDFIFATLSNFSAFSVQLDTRVLLYTSGVCLVASLLFGLVPALQASKADVNSALKCESSNPAFRGSRLRALFLASQIASSVALLVVAGTFVKSLIAGAYVGAKARQMEHLLLAQITADDRTAIEREELYRGAKEGALAIPGVEAATLIDSGSSQQRRFTRPGEIPIKSELPLEVAEQRVDDSYFHTLNLVLQRGSSFSPTESNAEVQEAIVNEAMARKFWNLDSAVGQRFNVDTQPYIAIGIVNDGAQPMVYTRLSPANAKRVTLLLRTRGSADNFVVPVIGALRRMVTWDRMPMVNTYREMAFRSLREITRLAMFIGAIALALAAAGIYASVAFSTNQRTREIGVRMALGAPKQAVVALVLKAGLKVIAVGTGIGLILAMIGLRLLFGLISTGSGFDPLAVGSVLIFFGGVALLACLLPAWRAARIDPVVALRHD